MREKMKSLKSEVDRALHAMAPSKEEWREAIDEVDHDFRCAECNSVVGRHHQFAALLRLSGALSDAIAECERQVAHADLLQA
jgi:hypothetical protein